MTTWSGDPADLVDLERYPLVDLAGEALAAVLARARAQLAELGAAELPGFVNAEGMRLLLEDSEALAPKAWHSGGTGTAYLAPAPDDAPEGDPRRWTGPYSTGAVAYDLFPTSSPLRVLYEWDALKDFVQAILQAGPLYRYADPCGALNLAVMTEGEQLQWHYDMTDFVVSLAIRDAAEGGDFEVSPRIRSATDENFAGVSAVLAGERAGVLTLEMTPGTLLVFAGRYSLHRVSPVVGPVDRYVGLLAYDTSEGTVSSDSL
ncbi:MAG TPA: hypothetical protein VGP46_11280, partial [Acidimicrobiales bacterium]|nr:hypothetical protein [Acidimicrobiales bacterium]